MLFVGYDGLKKPYRISPKTNIISKLKTSYYLAHIIWDKMNNVYAIYYKCIIIQARQFENDNDLRFIATD